MSLLLEALKKAERDKLALDPAQRAAAEQSGLSSLSSLGEASAEETLPGYPPSPSAPPPAASPTAGGTLELMQKEKPAPPQQHLDDSARQHHERKAAQNVFAAKQDGAGVMAVGRVGKGLIVAGVALLAIIGGGAYYVWQEITRTPGIGAVSGSGPAPVLAPVATSTPPPASLPATPITVIPKEAVPPAPLTAKELTPLRQADRGGETGEEFDITPAPVRARVKAAPIEPAIKLQRKQSANEIPPLLTAAYQAYLAGDLVSARQKYLQQLQHDPRNKDVLLGLAAIAVHLQQPGEAQAYYLRVLESDPQDASAIAGMTGLGQQLHPSQAQTESRLKTLLAQQPDAAALHFTLGNHYASQLRWGEAQQAFFRALSIDASNAEYAFNLAVSLDHLNQNKLAVEYYNKALVLTGATPAGFDRALAARRIAELSIQ